MTGLSTLSKGLIEHEDKIHTIDNMIVHMQEIIGKYENEIKTLQIQITEQTEIINKQEGIVQQQEVSLQTAIAKIETLMSEIDKIWNS